MNTPVHKLQVFISLKNEIWFRTHAKTYRIKMKSFLLLSVLLLLEFSALFAQNVCSQSGNLVIYSNYDGGIVTIDVDTNIPDLKIGICTYEPVRVTIIGTYAANVSEVVYAGFNSTQNNNNCNQGNFNTSISGVPANKRRIITYPEVGYDNPNGWPNLVGVAGQCDANQNAGGGNTPDQVVYYFQQETGGALYAHFTQYECWQNDTYKVSEGGNCCVLPTSSNVQASFNADATDICPGTCIDFSNTSTGEPFTDFSWQFEGGDPAVSDEQSPKICYNSPGSYAVTLTVVGASGNNTLTRNAYIKVNDRASPGGFAYTSPVCPNDTSLVAIRENGFIEGGSWSSSPGLIIDTLNGTIRPAESEPGDHVVYYYPLETGCLEKDTVSYGFNIEDLEEVLIKPSGEVLLCAGDSITLNGPLGYAVYSWNEGASDLSSIRVSDPGNYYLALESTNGCSLQSDTVSIVSAEQPKAAFSYQQTNGYQVVFSNLSSGASSYSWFFPSGVINTDENPDFVFLYDDVWPVSLIASGPCGSDTLDSNVVVIKTNIPNTFTDEFLIYQIGNSLFLKIPDHQISPVSVEIFDLSGRLIQNRSMIIHAAFNEIPLAEIQAALLFVRITTDSKQWVIRRFISAGQ
jgi:PKD repeat protein